MQTVGLVTPAHRPLYRFKVLLPQMIGFGSLTAKVFGTSLLSAPRLLCKILCFLTLAQAQASVPLYNTLLTQMAHGYCSATAVTATMYTKNQQACGLNLRKALAQAK